MHQLVLRTLLSGPHARLLVTYWFHVLTAHTRALALYKAPLTHCKNEAHRRLLGLPQRPQAPAPEFPIRTTYSDTCVEGCLRHYGRDFARLFVASTSEWTPEALERAWLLIARF